jgi:hypothetical protein
MFYLHSQLLYFLLYSFHNMFRPLWAIIRWVLKRLQVSMILAYVNGSVGYVATCIHMQ